MLKLQTKNEYNIKVPQNMAAAFAKAVSSFRGSSGSAVLVQLNCTFALTSSRTSNSYLKYLLVS